MLIDSRLLFVCNVACAENTRSREIRRLVVSYFLYAAMRMLKLIEAERYVDQWHLNFCTR
jgi:hypothetical protein